MDKFVPGSPCPYHRSYTKTITARYKEKDQVASGGGGGGGGAAAQLQVQARKMEPIWDIVSGLAKALTEARDQIATLMKHQKQNGGGERTPSPVHRTPRGVVNLYAHNRCPPRSPRDHSPHVNRNVHRSHAHGFCAFGRNSEFKELMHHNADGVRYSSPRYADQYQQQSGSNASSTRDRQQTGRGGAYGLKLKGGGGSCGISVVPGSKSFTCSQVKGQKGIHLTAKMRDCHMKLDADDNKFEGEHHPVKIRITAPTIVRPPPSDSRKPSPEVRRYCVGTQYASLLKEEAHHLREQRSAVEPKVKKKKIWNNY